MRPLLLTLLLLPLPALADVVCPDLQKDKTSFQLVARGTVTQIIEPVYEYGCEKRNQYAQCESPLERKATPFQRMIFEMDEVYYVSAAASPFFLSNYGIKAGMRIEELPGLSHRAVIVGRKDMLGQKGLLRSFERMSEPGTQGNGDFMAGRGCDDFIEQSNPGYAVELEAARKMRQ